MLEKAKTAGVIKGVILDLIEGGGGLTHLQYAEDTVIFLEANDEYVTNLKFILYCFEEMSGLKINFHKSEVIVLGYQKKRAPELLIA
jgi:hypothetical protein